jgi:hypothetical protein
VTRLHSILLTAVLVSGVAVGAQEPAPAPAAAPTAPTKGLIPLEVEVVITRYEGTKKLSSLPYVLALNGGGTEVQLNMGTQVAVPTTAIAPANADGKGNPFTTYNYRDVGTRISARARIVEGGYDLQLNIDDSSVYTSSTPGMAGAQMPAFRTFSSRNSLLLRDGQTREYTAATDRINGEVVKVSVALRVVK